MPVVDMVDLAAPSPPSSSGARVGAAAGPRGPLPAWRGALGRSRWTLVACTVLIYGAVVAASEKIEVYGGLGWDGALYGTWVSQGKPPFAGNVIARYYVSRALPLTVAHQALLRLKVTRTAENVIRAFEVMNILLVLLGAWVWTHLADVLALRARTRWLGALILFGNFSHLKMSAFYPVLLDEFAFALGLLQVLLFLTRRRWALLVVTALGAFCWPTILLSGVALLACIPTSRRSPGAAPAPMPRLAASFALAGAVGLGLVCRSLIARAFDPGTSTEPITPELARLSVVAAVAAAYAGWRPLLALGVLPAVRRPRDHLSFNVVLGLALLAGVIGFQRAISVGGSTYAPVQLDVNMFTAIQKPAIFVVAHTVFFGPLVLVILLRWRQLVARLARFGPGLPLVMLGGVFLFLNSESRRLGDVFAMVAPFGIQVLDDDRLSPKFLALFAALSLFFSKAWLTISGDIESVLSTFPAQWYFMNHGPWMAMPGYLVQGALVIGAAIWLAYSLPPAAAMRAGP